MYTCEVVADAKPYTPQSRRRRRARESEAGAGMGLDEEMDHGDDDEADEDDDEDEDDAVDIQHSTRPVFVITWDEDPSVVFSADNPDGACVPPGHTVMHAAPKWHCSPVPTQLCARCH